MTFRGEGEHPLYPSPGSTTNFSLIISLILFSRVGHTLENLNYLKVNNFKKIKEMLHMYIGVSTQLVHHHIKTMYKK